MNIDNFKLKLNTLKAYQLKQLISDFSKVNESGLKKIVKVYKKGNKEITPNFMTMTKKQLIDLVVDNKINPNNFMIIQKNPIIKGAVGVYKKYGLKEFTPEEQKQYLIDLNNTKRFKNPLKALAQYTDKTGNKQFLELQKHQEDFIKQFIFSNLRGAVVFHGVGSGKTLTAVVSSYYYLKMYPTHKVVVISPPALLYNFVNGLMQYGIDIRDKRYHFITYDKFSRSPINCLNSLLIVDEAHNFRTAMNHQIVRDDEDVFVEMKASKNVKGDKILQFGAMKSHKIILLTGTAFVNQIYDIENLLAMVDKRLPILLNTFATDVLGNTDTLKDYFNYRISYFKSGSSSDFPKVETHIKWFFMTPDEESDYKDIKSEGRPNNTSEKPNTFLSAERYASNKVGDPNQKINFIEEILLEKPNEKFIIYTPFMDAGIRLLTSVLKENNIGFKIISGSQSVREKEDSRQFFNGYDFNDPNFFNLKTMDFNTQHFINNKFRVLLITKAGAEGVDTINCENLIMLDGAWNEATVEQVVARAVRYKSHIGLPKNKRVVNVYKLFLVKEDDRKTVERISVPNFDDWSGVINDVKQTTKLLLDLDKKTQGSFLPTNTMLLELKDGKGNPFIPMETIFIKVKHGIGRKSTIEPKGGVLGWNEYKGLTNKIDRDNWKREMYAKWFVIYGEKKTGEDSSISGFSNSSDLRMYILAKSKTKNINQFISYFGDNIKLFESFQSKLLKTVAKYEAHYGKQLSNTQQAKLYAKLLAKHNVKILKAKIIDDIGSRPYGEKTGTKRTNEAEKQQYFTNDILAEALLDYTNIEGDNTNNITVLEPSAGFGALIKPILRLKKDITIDLVEIDNKARDELEKLVNLAPDSLELLNQRNFLKLITSKRYNYIFMNPPFHLRGSEIGDLIRDVYDFDFVKRAYALLEVGGELVAITSKHYLMEDDMKDWYNSVGAEIKILKDEKFGTVKIDVAIVHIKKEDLEDDDEILKKMFYKSQKNALAVGIDINFGIVDFDEGLKGSSLQVKTLKRLIDNSYQRKDKNGKLKQKEYNIDGYNLDNNLTNDTSAVYYNKDKNHVVHSVRGTNGTLKDWSNNAIYMASPELYKKTDRYLNAKEIQKKIDDKYTTAKKTMTTHSQSGIIGRHLGVANPNMEVISLNPATFNKDNNIDNPNEYTVKSTKDLVSLYHKNKARDTIIKGESLDQYKEHDIGLLDRLNPNMLIGNGFYFK